MPAARSISSPRYQQSALRLQLLLPCEHEGNLSASMRVVVGAMTRLKALCVVTVAPVLWRTSSLSVRFAGVRCQFPQPLPQELYDEPIIRPEDDRGCRNMLDAQVLDRGNGGG